MMNLLLLHVDLLCQFTHLMLEHLLMHLLNASAVDLVWWRSSVHLVQDLLHWTYLRKMCLVRGEDASQAYVCMTMPITRSEARRVGKEGRSRGSAYH